ncbi:hypothetical protein ACFQ1I_40305 [Kitasatospora arboriphila]
MVVLHAEIQTEFGVAFPLVRLFEHASFNAQRKFLEILLEEPGRSTPNTGAATAARLPDAAS